MHVKHDRSPIEQTLAAEVDPDCSLCEGYLLVRYDGLFRPHLRTHVCFLDTRYPTCRVDCRVWCQDNIMQPKPGMCIVRDVGFTEGSRACHLEPQKP